VTKCLALAILVSTAGSKVLHYLFILEEDHNLVVFYCIVVGGYVKSNHYAGGGFALSLI
jgi:hypothetical protein